MGLFNFFRKNGVEQNGNRNNAIPDSDPEKTGTLPVQEADSKAQPGFIPQNGSENGMEQIYTFLQADYESKGYGDALINADDTYKMDNIRLMKLDLQILIEKTNSYYETLLSELNLHIATRTRAGLVDLVEELENRKSRVEDQKNRLKSLIESMNDENGLCQRIILSYQRGFMKGLSAITQSNILNKKI